MSLKLVSVDRSDKAIEILYNLLGERPAEANVSHQVMPTRQEHRRFVTHHPYRCWYLIVTNDDDVAGAIYATHLNEIGIAIFEDSQGKGWGRAAIRALMAAHKPLRAIPGARSGKWLANINHQNERSIKLFTRMGFALVQHTYGLAV